MYGEKIMVLEERIVERNKIEQIHVGAGKKWVEYRGLDQYEDWLKPQEAVGYSLIEITDSLVRRFGQINALDLGAGVGKALTHIAAIHGKNAGDLHGISLEAHDSPIEVNPENDRFLKKLAKTGRKIPKIHTTPTLHIADARNLPFPNNHFQLTISNRGALWYAPQVDKTPGVLLDCLKEADRVTAPGGIIAVHAARVDREQRLAIIRYFKNQGHTIKVIDAGRIVPPKDADQEVQHKKFVLPDEESDAKREATLRKLVGNIKNGRAEFWNVYYIEKGLGKPVLEIS